MKSSVMHQMTLPPLLAGLLANPASLHATSEISVVETHISWVLLTGEYAYKIKKPVHFSFLDFSTLELRRAACENELDLNRRLASGLYIEVVPIVGTVDHPDVGTGGPIIEWAVKMRQFPKDDQLDLRLAAGRLDAQELEAFGATLARFHNSLPGAAADQPYGEPDQVVAMVRANFADLQPLFADDAERASVVALHAWTEAHAYRFGPLMARRKRDGRVREGHGDLHLANLVRWHDRITAFDCIEFDPALRWSDVICDTAFLVMDLLRHGRQDLAYRFLNAWLEETGDYDSLPLLHYYVVYRALVRAKIAMILRANSQAEGCDAENTEVQAHLRLAQRLVAGQRPALILMHGLSGSGKSWLSAGLMIGLPAIRVRSDVERKRLCGLSASEHSGSGLAEGLYTASASERTYERLLSLARAALDGGETVIVDAAFLSRSQRRPFIELARSLGLQWIILDCQAPLAKLRRRIEARLRSGDASEADGSVLEWQLAHQQPLDAAERRRALQVDTTRAEAPKLALEALRSRFWKRRPKCRLIETVAQA
jgi:aminoglycoside phosphotransferase family enzyme/predicted kinase